MEEQGETRKADREAGTQVLSGISPDELDLLAELEAGRQAYQHKLWNRLCGRREDVQQCNVH